MATGSPSKSASRHTFNVATSRLLVSSLVDTDRYVGIRSDRKTGFSSIPICFIELCRRCGCCVGFTCQFDWCALSLPPPCSYWNARWNDHLLIYFLHHRHLGRVLPIIDIDDWTEKVFPDCQADFSNRPLPRTRASDRPGGRQPQSWIVNTVVDVDEERN